MLWSASSPQADLLEAVPHRTFGPGRLLEAVPHRTFGPGRLLEAVPHRTFGPGRLLEAVPHRTFVPGRLFVALATVGVAPGGAVGVGHLTHHRLGRASFGEPYDEVCRTLRAGLRIEGHDNGVLAVPREGGPATGAGCLPDFHEELSELVGADRFLVGVGCPDMLVVAAESSPDARRVRSLVLDSGHPAGELVPRLLVFDSTGISFVAERR